MRKPFVPTPDDRRKVEVAAGLGLNHEDIRRTITAPITGKAVNRKVFYRCFINELKNGPAKIRLQVGVKMLQRAMADTSDHACYILARKLLDIDVGNDSDDAAGGIVIKGGLPEKK